MRSVFRSCSVAIISILASVSMSAIAAAVVLAPDAGFTPAAFEPTSGGTVQPAAAFSSQADHLASASIDVLGGRSPAADTPALTLMNYTFTGLSADVAGLASTGTHVQGAGASR